MSRSTVMQVDEPGAPLIARTVELPPVKPGWVRVDVVASGVCYADIATAAASGKDTVFPVTPGHEVAGTVAELGSGVTRWQVGQRVAVGWFGGSCGQCAFCRSGDPVHCPERMITARSFPGGWAQTIDAPTDALAAVPDGMDLFDAAPMGCAGVTTFNAIRHAGIRAGATVAVFGVGGLGHLAIQFAAAMGYRTIAIARGPEREDLACRLGAHEYIDAVAHLPGEALAALGGADLIVATAPTTEPIPDLIEGLAVGGRIVLIGVDGGMIPVPTAALTTRSLCLTGHLTGSALDTEEAMRFAHTNGVRPMIERMPLTEAGAAVARICAGAPRFRIVLDPRSTR